MWPDKFSDLLPMLQAQADAARVQKPKPPRIPTIGASPVSRVVDPQVVGVNGYGRLDRLRDQLTGEGRFSGFNPLLDLNPLTGATRAGAQAHGELKRGKYPAAALTALSTLLPETGGIGRAARPLERIEKIAIRTPEGRIVEGLDHMDAIEKAGLHWRTFDDANSGFITNTGRFVDRYEADRIADAADQIDQGAVAQWQKDQHTGLASENLKGIGSPTVLDFTHEAQLRQPQAAKPQPKGK